MVLKPLPIRSPLAEYSKQAGQLLAAHKSGDSTAIEIIHRNHPRFLDSKITWLPRSIPDSEVRDAAFDLADAQLTVARWHSFRDWPALTQFVDAVNRDGSPVQQFEFAVEAVIDGDLAALESMLKADPELVRARSSRVTHSDPPRHRATLLHYLGANGVENHRQRTPPNAVEIAKTLLRAGAEVDAPAYLYGGPCTTLNLLVSSYHPHKAGLQIALAETLIDFGAASDGAVLTALGHGYPATAEALVRRGAKIDGIAAAAGLGRAVDVERMLAAADPLSRHRALSLSAQNGHVEVVRMLLDAGADPNRYNPPGNHPHSTPLHQAVWGGHEAVATLLVERGARLDLEDTIYRGTPLGWAEHGGQEAIAKFLRESASGSPSPQNS